MGQLSVYLPPLAPDYSGCCAILYGLNSLIVIHDAQGCTANYTGFDEPRWYGSKKGVFCSGLRKIDVAMGNEERYILRILEAAKTLKPDVIGIVGSPVPMVIGTDFDGIASEIEARSGIATIGLNSNGLGQYWEGMGKAGVYLLDRFLGEKFITRKESVNILGVTPLDFTSQQYHTLQCKLKNHGYHILASLGRNIKTQDLTDMLEAEVNLVVSQGGLEIARWMEKYFHIPYVAGLPIGDGKIYFESLERVKESGESQILKHENTEEREILILHDPVIAHSLALNMEGKVRVGTPFRCDKNLSKNTLVLENESSLEEELNLGYQKIIADPLILDLVYGSAEKIPLAHFAVSSHFRQAFAKNFLT